MERPTDDHGLTHKVLLVPADTRFGGTISRLQARGCCLLRTVFSSRAHATAVSRRGALLAERGLRTASFAGGGGGCGGDRRAGGGGEQDR